MGISIKGKNGGGFEIAIQPSTPYAEVTSSIKEKLSKNKDFFTGSEAKLYFSGKELSRAQQIDLKRLLAQDYDIINVSFEGVPQKQTKETSAEKPQQSDELNSAEGQVELVSKEHFDAKSIFVSHTLRSGQRIECAGDVIVLGDVNVGAQVIAGGSIAVMGTLRGLVHAGAMGRSDVVVAANVMIPGQLRISGKIAVFPEGKAGDVPEIAEFKQGSVIIRPLKPQKRQMGNLR